MNDILPGKAGDIGVTAKDNRFFVEGVLYRYRAGISWRDLPESFGDFKTIDTGFRRRSQKGAYGKRSLKH